MADNNDNPELNALSQANDGSIDENVEYEYVELEDGQELPEGYEYEYEYVELTDGENLEVSELDVVASHSQPPAQRPISEDVGFQAELSQSPEVVQFSTSVQVPAIPETIAEPELEMMEEEGIPPITPLVVDEGEEYNPEEIEEEREIIRDKALSDYIFAEEEDLEEQEEIVKEFDVVEGQNTITIENDSIIETTPNEMSLDDMLGDVKEPQFESSLLSDDMGIELEASVSDEKLSEMVIKEDVLEISEPKIFLNNEIFGSEGTKIDEATSVNNEKSIFVKPEHIKFQNEDNSVKDTKDWFRKNEPGQGLTSKDVNIDDLVNKETFLGDASLAVEDYLEPGASVYATEIEEPVAAETVLEVEEEEFIEESVAEETVLEVGEEEFIEESVAAETVLEVEEKEFIEESVAAETVLEVGEEEFIEEPVAAETVLEVGEEEFIEEPVAAETVLEVEEKEFIEEPVVEETILEVGEEEFIEESVAAETVLEVGEEEFIEVPVAEEIIFDAIATDILISNESNEKVEIFNNDILPLISDYRQDQFDSLASRAKFVTKNDGIQYFKASAENATVVLSEIDFENNELNAWNLNLFAKEIKALKSKMSELNMPQSSGLNRIVTLVKNGIQKASFFNEDNLKIINASDACVAVDGRFVCGDLGTNSGIIVDDYITISLADFAGKNLNFAFPVNGLLTGPKGMLLYFFGLNSLLIPNSEVTKIDAEKLQYKISKWYSGTSNDKYFEFDAKSPSATFEGNDEVKAIHVNVNNSSYGWNVVFDNELSMNLRDLREYQTRFGKMPSPNGVISYGQTKLIFSNVERIVVYESAQYYFYS